MLLYGTLTKVTSTNMRKKHVRRDSKMCCCCCCRFCCGAPTTDERIHAPVLHDASQIAYCRYWGRASLPPTTSTGDASSIQNMLARLNVNAFTTLDWDGTWWMQVVCSMYAQHTSHFVCRHAGPSHDLCRSIHQSPCQSANPGLPITKNNELVRLCNLEPCGININSLTLYL